MKLIEGELVVTDADRLDVLEFWSVLKKCVVPAQVSGQIESEVYM